MKMAKIIDYSEFPIDCVPSNHPILQNCGLVSHFLKNCRSSLCSNAGVANSDYCFIFWKRFELFPYNIKIALMQIIVNINVYAAFYVAVPKMMLISYIDDQNRRVFAAEKTLSAQGF